jgi:hypothetical protein
VESEDAMTASPMPGIRPRRAAAWGLWRRWVLATTIGELVGFAVPAAVGALALLLRLPDAVLIGLIVPAGMVEGAVLAGAQWPVIRSVVPGVAGRRWVLATALAAGLAYLIGFTPANIGDLSAISPPVLVAGGLLLGLVFVLSLGGAQWLVLRCHLPRAGWWVVANAVAWPLGVAIPVVALGLLPDGAPPMAWAVTGIAAGALMGGGVGAITGLALVWLVQGRAAPSSPEPVANPGVWGRG